MALLLWDGQGEVDAALALPLAAGVGLYWVLVTMSTLGFGDITFKSDIGRLFSVVVLVTFANGKATTVSESLLVVG